MDAMVKKSLGEPIKQLTNCMTGAKDTKRGPKKSQAVRRKSIVRRKSAPCTSQKVPDSWLRVYQADLQRERKLREASCAKKAAERNVRMQFRSQHSLRRPSIARRPAPRPGARRQAAKGDGASLFGAFQGLSLDGLTSAAQGSMSANTDQCKVM